MNQLPLIKGYAKPILLLRFASGVTTLRIAVVGHTGSRKKVTPCPQPFVTRLNPKTPIMHTHNFHSRTSIHTIHWYFLESSSLYCHLLIHIFLFIIFHSCHLFFFSSKASSLLLMSSKNESGTSKEPCSERSLKKSSIWSFSSFTVWGVFYFL